MMDKSSESHRAGRPWGCLLLSVLMMALLFSACTSPQKNTNPAAPPEITLTVEMRPDVVVADGTSHGVVFVEMHSGTDPVADSTQIILLNTMGTLGRGILYTHLGVALDTLTSDTIAGSGWVIAYSEGVRDSAQVTFTAR